jgi:hypothetical protein
LAGSIGSFYDHEMDTEKELLVSFLEEQRNHVIGITEGLTEEQFRTVLVPSGWSCHSLLQHLAVGVEQYWLQCIVGGDSLAPFNARSAAGEGEWHVEEELKGESLIALYRENIRRSNEIIAATPLSAPPKQREEMWGDWPVNDLRFILLHLIEETACHAGHLDIVREMIDGKQWVVI